MGGSGPNARARTIWTPSGADPESGCIQRAIGNGDRGCSNESGTPRRLSIDSGNQSQKFAETFMGKDQSNTHAFN